MSVGAGPEHALDRLDVALHHGPVVARAVAQEEADVVDPREHLARAGDEVAHRPSDFVR